jgi:hypothetical protein
MGCVKEPEGAGRMQMKGANNGKEKRRGKSNFPTSYSQAKWG